MSDPWGDQVDVRWTLTDDDDLETLARTWFVPGERSRDIVESARLDDLAAPGERFEGGTATLSSILFHLLQEFARHAGDLDIVRELIDGVVAEDGVTASPIGPANPISPPGPIVHIALPQDWAAAQADGAYQVSTRGTSLADQGFIHCAFPDQVTDVANRYYADVPEVVLLHLDPVRLGAEVRVEPGSADGAERFPHLFGPIPVAAVDRAVTWRRDPDDGWRRPASPIPSEPHRGRTSSSCPRTGTSRASGRPLPR